MDELRDVARDKASRLLPSMLRIEVARFMADARDCAAARKDCALVRATLFGPSPSAPGVSGAASLAKRTRAVPVVRTRLDRGSDSQTSDAAPSDEPGSASIPAISPTDTSLSRRARPPRRGTVAGAPPMLIGPLLLVVRRAGDSVTCDATGARPLGVSTDTVPFASAGVCGGGVLSDAAAAAAAPPVAACTLGLCSGVGVTPDIPLSLLLCVTGGPPTLIAGSCAALDRCDGDRRDDGAMWWCKWGWGWPPAELRGEDAAEPIPLRRKLNMLAPRKLEERLGCLLLPLSPASLSAMTDSFFLPVKVDCTQDTYTHKHKDSISFRVSGLLARLPCEHQLGTKAQTHESAQARLRALMCQHGVCVCVCVCVCLCV